jgi:excinuclease ABC subunit B
MDRLRHSATDGVALSRRDVVVVASVSCIYGLGSPEYEDFKRMVATVSAPASDLEPRGELMRKFIDLQYAAQRRGPGPRHVPGARRHRGSVHPADDERALRIEFFGDEIERIVTLVNPLTDEASQAEASQAVHVPRQALRDASRDRRSSRAVRGNRDRARRAARAARVQGKLLEAQRLLARTSYDLEMIQRGRLLQRHRELLAALRLAGPAGGPALHADRLFPRRLSVIIDESHVTIPQLRGDVARATGRARTPWSTTASGCPAARDNRPLTVRRVPRDASGSVLFVSATPGPFELARGRTPSPSRSSAPQGWSTPKVIGQADPGQVADLIERMRQRTERRRADPGYHADQAAGRGPQRIPARRTGLRVRYLHSDIETVERVEILRSLRLGEFDVLVGINLLREGLDLPEVSLVAILDADKEGFLRSETSLIQTIGRAARNVDGQVVMYADQVTEAMRRALDETERRRDKQLAYNEEHGIDPQTVRKRVGDIIAAVRAEEQGEDYRPDEAPVARDLLDVSDVPQEDLRALIQRLEEEMHEAAADLRFEYAARLRDEVADLKRELHAMESANV